MVALLAGTRTSPERKFPSMPVSTGEGDEAARKRELGDRRAVTAVFNVLLSILGSGLATWWAAGRLAWRDEWVRPHFTGTLLHARHLHVRFANLSCLPIRPVVLECNVSSLRKFVRKCF